MADITATDASKRFAAMLDAVEHDGESFTIVRRGRPVAHVSPVQGGTVGELRRTLRDHPLDPEFGADVAAAVGGLLPSEVRDPWTD